MIRVKTVRTRRTRKPSRSMSVHALLKAIHRKISRGIYELSADANADIDVGYGKAMECFHRAITLTDAALNKEQERP